MWDKIHSQTSTVQLFFPHLANSTGFWRPNGSIIQDMTLKYDFFERVSVWSNQYIFIFALLVKATLMHSLLQKLEVNKAGFHGASYRLASCNSRTIWTYNVQLLPDFFKQTLKFKFVRFDSCQNWMHLSILLWPCSTQAAGFRLGTGVVKALTDKKETPFTWFLDCWSLHG